MLTTKQLCERLGISARKLKTWCDEGLPFTLGGKNGRQKQFEPLTVRQWMLANGKATLEQAEQQAQQPANPPDQIATTRDEAARLLGVDLRTLARYLKEPDFPGRAGSPGRRDGYFPIGAIEVWKAARFGGDGRSAAADREMAEKKMSRLDIQISRERLELERELGSICDVEEQARFYERQIATLKAILAELPDKIEAQLPPKVGRKFRQRLRRIVEQNHADALSTLAEIAEGDSDPTDEEPLESET